MLAKILQVSTTMFAASAIPYHSHGKVGNLPALDGLTGCPVTPISFVMKTKNTISGAIKALICLAFVMALLLFPPVALHGQVGVSGGLQVATYDIREAIYDHGEPDAVNGHCSASVSNADGGVGTNQCCNSICLSFVLEEGHSPSSDQPLPSHEIALHAQMVAYDPSGFLRPPKT